MIPFLKFRKKIQVYWLLVKMYILIYFCCLLVNNYVRIKEFSSRGVQAQPTEKKTFDNVFISFYLTLVLHLFSVILSYLRKTITLKGSSSDRGSSWRPTFSKGGMSHFFLEEVGVNADFYRNLVIFRGGGV